MEINQNLQWAARNGFLHFLQDNLIESQTKSDLGRLGGFSIAREQVINKSCTEANIITLNLTDFDGL